MDISMCDNTTCPLKESCVRFKGERDEIGQTMGNFSFINGECEHYLKITDSTPLTNKDEMSLFYENVLKIFKSIRNEQI